MAENSRADSGVQVRHLIWALDCGLAFEPLATAQRRSLGRSASVASCSAGAHSLTGICMLDWPEQSQTSPNRISLRTMVRPTEEIFSGYGPPAGSGSNRACQWPSEPTVAVSSLVARLTLTWALVSPSPHTQIGRSR